MTFFEYIAGFLFRPYTQCNILLAELHSHPKQFKKSFVFVVYGSIILGIVFLFWIFYPECLYYGVSFDSAYRNLLFINLSTPMNLLVIFLFIVGLLVIFHFLLVGLCNYIVGCLFSEKKLSRADAKNYLAAYGYGSTLPLLLLGVFIIFWVYFFEKFYIATEIAPYIDFTFPVIVFFSIFFGFLIYKWIIETRINQAFFKVSIFRAVIPELIQVIGFIGFYMVLSYLIGTFAGSLELV
ncbi:MAG: hypothetical protein ACTSYB_05555 [Candidatus Helarchaeota archaeon]